ncbi:MULTISPECIES: GntR family transcriptional regulator [unclassified Providencia]|uniref:GntR family transcriptional regulator n=1 Tax=unclassified Providencia TaxID=2633465 RepID=UPI001B676872|nr:GntR family transcriptional regulator [Providencia sp.]MBP6080241.1 GntR family transcriptional regulator [Providencia sp.]
MKKQLDHSAHSKPLYAQVYDILVDKLNKGEYRKNDTFPTEAEFQEMFGISRITARRALSELEKEGYVKRSRGVGTLVIRNSKKAYATIHTQILGAPTLRVKRKIISIIKIAPNAEICEIMNLAQGTELIRVERIIAKGKLNIQYNCFYFSPCIESVTEHDLEESIYLFLESQGLNSNHYTEKLSAVIPTKQEMKLLNIDEKTPVFSRRRIDYNKANEAILYMEGSYLSDYYEYKVNGS